MGAGRVDVATATTSPLIAYETDEPGGVSVSFGAVDSLGATSLTRTVTVVNKGGSTVTGNVMSNPRGGMIRKPLCHLNFNYTVAHSPGVTLQPGFEARTFDGEDCPPP